MTANIDTKLIVDTCGTRCPVPILRAKAALKQLNIGDYLSVLATDPAAKPDFDAMLRHLPHELINFEQLEPHEGQPKTVYRFIIRKG